MLRSATTSETSSSATAVCTKAQAISDRSKLAATWFSLSMHLLASKAIPTQVSSS